MSSWANNLSKIYDDSEYIKTLNIQSTLPYAYRVNLNAGAACKVDMLPQTSECRGFFVGAKTIDNSSMLRPKPTHLGEVSYRHPQTGLVSHAAYKAAGEGRFSSQQVDVESALIQPGSVHSRGRTLSEVDYQRFDYNGCPNAAENYRRGGVDTRLNNVQVLGGEAAFQHAEPIRNRK
jgi:hypothetical protein